MWFEFQSGQTFKVNGLSLEMERKDERSPSPQSVRTTIPLIGPPKQNGAGSSSIKLAPLKIKRSLSALSSLSAVMGSSSSHSLIRSPAVQEPPQLTSSSNPPLPSPPLPHPILPAAARGPSQPPTSPASLPASPNRVLTSQVLTHLVEGFVIREGLEPFPVIFVLS